VFWVKCEQVVNSLARNLEHTLATLALTLLPKSYPKRYIITWKRLTSVGFLC